MDWIGRQRRESAEGGNNKFMMKSFHERVKAVVASIPEGKTMTYKQVAVQAGSPLAYRAVGSCLRKNYDPSIPCHRVIRSDGSPGGYNRGGPIRKRELLRAEKAVPCNKVTKKKARAMGCVGDRKRQVQGKKEIGQ